MKALSLGLIAIGTLLFVWQGQRLKSVRSEIARLRDQPLPNEPISIPSRSISLNQNSSQPLDKAALFDLFKPSGKAINREDTFAGLRRLSALDLRQLKEVWTSLDSHSLDAATSGWLRLPVSRLLVDLDPPFILDDLTAAGNHSSLAKLTLARWARHDPKGATEWLEGYAQSAESGETTHLRIALLSGVAISDPARALEMVSDLDAGRHREAFTEIAAHLRTRAHRETYLQKLTEHHDSQVRDAGLRAFAYNLLEYEGFEAAARAIEEFELEPESKWKLAERMITNDIGLDMPQRVGWLLENTSNSLRDEQIHHIVATWTHSDINAITNWLGVSEQETWYDHAVNTFTEFAREADPRTAAEWAQTIHNESVRHKAVDRVLAVWHRQDPEAASAYVTAAALPPNFKERWEK